MGDLSTVGIDVERAADVAAQWRACVGVLLDVAGEAADRAAALGLDAAVPVAAAAHAGDGLAVTADLLASRAAAMLGISWPGGTTAGPGRLGGAWRGGAPARDEPLDELVEWLASGPRGYLVTELAEPTAQEWAAMVGAGTMVDGNRTMRYFEVEPDPGGGVIVVDAFIPDRWSLFLEGDGRGHEDPIFGDLTSDDSRFVVVVDLETGRGSVQIDDTSSIFGTNEARPIEMDGAEVVLEPSTDPIDHLLPGVPLPVNVLEIPNQVSVESSDGELSIDIDVLNSIVPLGSVDGTIRLTDAGDGRYAATIDTDEYPSIGVYQYRLGEPPVVLARQDSDGVSHVLPWWPELPDLPDLPDPPPWPDWDGPLPPVDGPDLPDLSDLPDLPDLPGPLPDLPDLPNLPDLPDLGWGDEVTGSIDLGGDGAGTGAAGAAGAP